MQTLVGSQSELRMQGCSLCGFSKPSTRLHDAAVKALRDPGVQASLARLGVDIVGGTPEQFKAYIAAEIPKWAAIVKASGASMDK